MEDPKLKFKFLVIVCLNAKTVNYLLIAFKNDNIYQTAHLLKQINEMIFYLFFKFCYSIKRIQ